MCKGAGIHLHLFASDCHPLAVLFKFFKFLFYIIIMGTREEKSKGKTIMGNARSDVIVNVMHANSKSKKRCKILLFLHFAFFLLSVFPVCYVY